MTCAAKEGSSSTPLPWFVLSNMERDPMEPGSRQVVAERGCGVVGSHWAAPQCLARSCDKQLHYIVCVS